jgi:predicted membrane protein
MPVDLCPIIKQSNSQDMCVCRSPITKCKKSSREVLSKIYNRRFKIFWGRIDSLCLYEVTDSELDVLAKGPATSLYLNFAIFLLSTATSFSITLVTANIPSNHMFMLFVTCAVVGYTVGFFLLLLWLRNKKSNGSIVRKIRKRIPSQSK